MDYQKVAKEVLDGNMDFIFNLCENNEVTHEILYLVLYALCNSTETAANVYINMMDYIFTKNDIILIRSGLYQIPNLLWPTNLYSPEGLCQAARFNNKLLVEDYFTQLDIPQAEIKNAFCNACQGGYLPLVEYLFDKLDDLEFEEYPVHVAISNNRKEVLEFLLSNGFEETAVNNMTALHVACTNEPKLSIVKMLRLHNEQDQFGFTPLHRAVISNQIDVVKLLCENISDINMIDKQGKTPLFYACAHNHKMVMKILLNNSGKL